MKRLSEITESIWSDIQDRSAGDAVRKEDNIDDLNPEDFFYYLQERYDDGANKGFGYKDINLAKYGIMRSYSSNIIEICIPFDVVNEEYEHYGKTINFRNVRRLNLIFNRKTYEYKEPISITDGNDIEELLSKNGFIFEKRLPPDSSRVYPKKGETTNQTVINLIDLLITNAKEPMLKRK